MRCCPPPPCARACGPPLLQVADLSALAQLGRVYQHAAELGVQLRRNKGAAGCSPRGKRDRPESPAGGSEEQQGGQKAQRHQEAPQSPQKPAEAGHGSDASGSLLVMEDRVLGRGSLAVVQQGEAALLHQGRHPCISACTEPRHRLGQAVGASRILTTACAQHCCSSIHVAWCTGRYGSELVAVKLLPLANNWQVRLLPGLRQPPAGDSSQGHWRRCGSSTPPEPMPAPCGTLQEEAIREAALALVLSQHPCVVTVLGVHLTQASAPSQGCSASSGCFWA